jgi:hypothetical protein
MDCHAPDDTFDVTGSQFGVMLVPDFERPAEDEPMLEFQVADPDVLRQRLVDAGLRDSPSTSPSRSGVRFAVGSSSGTGAWAATRSPECWSPT